MVDDDPLPALSHEISATVRRALTLQDKLNQLRDRPYGSDSPLILVDFMSAIVDQTVRRLFDLSSRPGDPTVEVNALNQVLDEVSTHAEPVEHSADDILPWGLVYPVESLCRRISPESRILIYPHRDRGYSYAEALEPLRQLNRIAADSPDVPYLQRFPKFMALFSCPTAQSYDILQNAAWGHEIGHHLDTVFSVSSDVLAEPVLETGIPAVAGAPAQPSDADGAGEAMTEVPRGWSAVRIEVLNTWIKELVADLFSVHVFGPASIFAFAEIVPSLDRNRMVRRSHPPAWLRVAFMLDELQALGFDELLRDGGGACEAGTPERQFAEVKAAVGTRIAGLRAMCEVLAAQTQPGTLESSLLHDITAVKEDVAEQVRRVSRRSWACTASRVAQDVFHLVARLERGVPPCEVDVPGELTGRPTTLASIVNAGWFYRIWRGMDVMPRDLAQAAALRRDVADVNALVLKAIELSAIKAQLCHMDREGPGCG